LGLNPPVKPAYKDSVIEASWATKDEDEKLVADNKSAMQARSERVLGKDAECHKNLKSKVDRHGDASSRESLKKMFLSNGEKEVLTINTVFISGMPGVASKGRWGEGIVMLASRSDASGKPQHRLHMASMGEDANLEAAESSAEETCYCCGCLCFSAQQASYTYESDHTHATTMAHIGHLEQTLSRIKVESFHQSRLIADARVQPIEEKRKETETCCKCCSKCFSWNSVGNNWKKGAQLADEEMDRKRCTESVDREGSTQVSVHFPQQEKSIDLTERCAMVSTTLHTMEINFHGQKPCFAVADASQPFADVVKLSSILHGMVENEEADNADKKEHMWGSSNMGSTSSILPKWRCCSCVGCRRLSRFQKKCLISFLALVVVAIALTFYFISQEDGSSGYPSPSPSPYPSGYSPVTPGR
jgi:hypothetical protein